VEKAKKNIGILLDNIGPHQYLHLTPIIEILQEAHYKAVIFVNLANQHNLAGLISLASVAHHVNKAQYQTFLLNTNVPTVSIGYPLDNVSTVLVDQKAGMRKLMQHLCDDQNYKKIAFVRGFDKSIASLEREKIFIEEIIKRGLNSN